MAELAALIRQFDPSLNIHFGSEILSFNLENGQEELSAFFAPVILRPFENNGLHVTEVEPLVAYVLSMGSLSQAKLAAREDAFRAFVTGEMAARGGAIDIGKHTGLFVADKSVADKSA